MNSTDTVADFDKANHVERHVKAFHRANMKRGMTIAAVCNPFFILAVCIIHFREVMNVQNFPLVMICHGLVQALAITGLSILPKSYRGSQIIVTVMVSALFLTYLYIGYYNLSRDVPTLNLLNSSSVLVAMCLFSVILFPFTNFKPMLIFTIVIATATTVLYFSSSLFMVGIVQASLIFSMMAIVNVTVTNIRQNAAIDFEHQRLTQRIRTREREKELEFAREIQDAMPPSAVVTDERIKISHYQIKHHKVAGDWQSAHKMDDGSIVALVADATGKGVQAALIVRAVQTLWADAIGGRSFRPGEWIGKVNRILFSLGSENPQTVTLGLVVIGAEEIAYYSAGHVPLFVRVRTKSDISVKCLAARGGLLGIGPKVTFEPRTMPLEKNAKYTVFLGSDGVFSSGSRYRNNEISNMLASLEENPQKYIDELDVDDDRSLIQLKVS